MKLFNGSRIVVPILFGIIIGAYVVVFALQNTALLTVTLFSWHFSAPAALMITASIALGAALSLLALVPTFIRNDRYTKQLEEAKEAAESELSKYRITIPIAPPAIDAGALIMAERPREPIHLPR